MFDCTRTSDQEETTGRHLILTRILPCSFSTHVARIRSKCMLKSIGSSFAGAGPVFCDTTVTEHLFCRSHESKADAHWMSAKALTTAAIHRPSSLHCCGHGQTKMPKSNPNFYPISIPFRPVCVSSQMSNDAGRLIAFEHTFIMLAPASFQSLACECYQNGKFK